MSSELQELETRGERLLIVGDSQTAGLGVHGMSFAKLAAAQIGASEVLDISGVSKTTADTVADADQIRAFEPTLAILCSGGTESLVLAGPRVQRMIERWAPATWHGVAGLDPRPYYSRRLSRRIRQRITTSLKVAIKRAVIRATGGQRRFPLEHFHRSFESLLALLAELDCRAVFVSMWKMDDRLFPGTGAALEETQAVIEQCLADWPNATLVDIREAMDYFGDFQDDHLHFNEAGHRRVAELVVREIQASRPPLEQKSLVREG